VIKRLLTPAPLSSDLGLLVLRVVAGASLMSHGWAKVKDIDPFVKGLEQMQFPVPSVMAWLAAGSEFFGGILVAAGLLTRPAAIFAAATMGVAAFHVHAADPFEKKELAVLYLGAFVTVILTGPGRIALDALIAGSGGAAKSASK
jgi:putative oxidoreductase